MPKEKSKNFIRDTLIVERAASNNQPAAEETRKTEYNLTGGVYRRIEDVISGLNTIKGLSSHLKFSYYECGGYVEVKRVCTAACGKHKFTLSEEIAAILGFSYINFWIRPSEGIRVSRPACVSAVLPKHLFISTDICEPYFTGDTQTQLLAVVPVDARNYEYGATQTVTLTTPRFIPLMTSNFRTIEINLKDQFGNLIAFEHGTLNVSLVFRKIW